MNKFQPGLAWHTESGAERKKIRSDRIILTQLFFFSEKWLVFKEKGKGLGEDTSKASTKQSQLTKGCHSLAIIPANFPKARDAKSESVESRNQAPKFACKKVRSPQVCLYRWAKILLVSFLGKRNDLSAINQKTEPNHGKANEDIFMKHQKPYHSEGIDEHGSLAFFDVIYILGRLGFLSHKTLKELFSIETVYSAEIGCIGRIYYLYQYVIP